MCSLWTRLPSLLGNGTNQGSIPLQGTAGVLQLKPLCDQSEATANLWLLYWLLLTDFSLPIQELSNYLNLD